MTYDHYGKGHASDQCYWKIKTCFNCENPGHRDIECPKPSKIEDGRGQQQTSKKLTYPRPGGNSQRQSVKGKLFALTKQEVQGLDEVVEGTLFICDTVAHVLIDPGSTHSYVSPKFMHNLRIDPINVDLCITLSTTLGPSF